MENNLNLKIVEMILYRFSAFEPLRVRARPLTISLVNLITGLANPGKRTGGGYNKYSEHQNIHCFHILDSAMLK